jgi:uncharacterized Zn finger protein
MKDRYKIKIDKAIKLLFISDEKKIELPESIEFKTGDNVTVDDKKYIITNEDIIIETRMIGNYITKIYYTKPGVF